LLARKLVDAKVTPIGVLAEGAGVDPPPLEACRFQPAPHSLLVAWLPVARPHRVGLNRGEKPSRSPTPAL